MNRPETATKSTEPETPLARVLREQGRQKQWVAKVIGCGANRVTDLVAGRKELKLREAVLLATALGLPTDDLLPEKEKVDA